jgi:hypothetical protein
MTTQLPDNTASPLPASVSQAHGRYLTILACAPDSLADGHVKTITGSSINYYIYITMFI